MNMYLDLFLTFAKIGFFTFGGGYAMISMIENSCVGKKGWITHDELMNVTVIAESTPGPIAINAATYVGFGQAGLAGAMVATMGMILPSVGLIYLISVFLDNFLEITIISNAFKGIKIAVGLLILDTGIIMVKKMKAKAFPRFIMISSFIAMMTINAFSLNFSSITLMVSAAVLSLSVFIGKGGKKK